MPNKTPTLEQFGTNRNLLFWSLHAAGWAAYGITQYFGALLYEKPTSYARVIAVSAVAAFDDPGRARDLLCHRACAAYRHQSFLQGIRRAGLAGTRPVRAVRRCPVH